jgi:hypothetical protein
MFALLLGDYHSVFSTDFSTDFSTGFFTTWPLPLINTRYAMSSPKRLLAGLLLCAGAVSAEVGPQDGLLIAGIDTFDKHHPYGINGSVYREAFASPTVSSHISNVSITYDKGWDVQIRAIENVPCDGESVSHRQVTSVVAMSMKPTDGGFPGNSTLCYSVFYEMEEKTEAAVLRQGSRDCRGRLSDECMRDLAEFHHGNGRICNSGILPSTCDGHLEGYSISFSKFLLHWFDLSIPQWFPSLSNVFCFSYWHMIQDQSTNKLGDTGHFFARLSPPQDKDSEEAHDDFVSVTEKGYVVVITEPLVNGPAMNGLKKGGEVLCMAPVVLRDTGRNDEDDDNGASSLSSSAVKETLLMAALVSMLFAYM